MTVPISGRCGTIFGAPSYCEYGESTARRSREHRLESERDESDDSDGGDPAVNRREVVAGVASVGVLGSGGAVLWRGVPFGGERGSDASQNGTGNGTEDDDNGGGASTDGIEVEVLEAPDDETGTLAIPTDGVTLAVFFSPVCSRCRALAPNLADAQARLTDDYGDSLTVVSVTAQQSPDQLRDWWADHGGDWTLAYDSDRTLTEHYDVARHPVLLAIDDTGAVRWDHEGILEADRIVREVEGVLEAAGGDDA